MPEPLLTAEGLRQTYGSGHSAVSAVRGVDIAIEPGERLLIMGPSGSGKTTLLSMLGGLLTPTEGEVSIGGTSVYARKTSARMQLRLRKIGFVFQSFNLLSALTALENIEIPLRLAGHGRTAARARASELAARLGLRERAGSPPRDLSGGEKQRVAIARALANNPEVLLADEPTANLDSENGHQVAEILCKLGCEEGKAVLIVSHDQRLLDIASRVLWLEDGRIAETSKERLRR